jgi:thymidylate synthase
VHIGAETLDDLMREVFKALLKSGRPIRPSKGPAVELTGVLLELEQPRARLSRTEMKGTVFSCLGELCWYMSKKNDLAPIQYYLDYYRYCSDDGLTVHGGYGPRFFDARGHDQFANVLKTLKKKDSRQAVIQIFDAADIAVPHKDVPCTCNIQFMLRHEHLHMFTSMRSNDVFKGLPHDIFAFTFLQEIFATALGAKLGTYKHAVGSLHLYDDCRAKAKQYLREGWQEKVLMPPMPAKDPWSSVNMLVETESKIRAGTEVDIAELKLEPYWADLVRLLGIYTFTRNRKFTKAGLLRKQMSSTIYDAYIEKRLNVKKAGKK